MCNLFENKKFKRKDLEELFLAVVRVMENLDEYLMNRDFLLGRKHLIGIKCKFEFSYHR